MRRVAILLGAAYLALALAGCHGWYRIVFENHTDQQITLLFPEYRIQMRPCSVLYHSGPGPSCGSLMRVEARDAEGNVIHRTEFRAPRNCDPNPVLIAVPAQGAEACPTPVTDRYFLTMWNTGSKDVEVSHAGQPLGTVRAGGHERFGPLPGTWRDLDGVVIRNPAGEEATAADFHKTMNYDLGQVPQLDVYVIDW